MQKSNSAISLCYSYEAIDGVVNSNSLKDIEEDIDYVNEATLNDEDSINEIHDNSGDESSEDVGTESQSSLVDYKSINWSKKSAASNEQDISTQANHQLSSTSGDVFDKEEDELIQAISSTGSIQSGITITKINPSKAAVSLSISEAESEHDESTQPNNTTNASTSGNATALENASKKRKLETSLLVKSHRKSTQKKHHQGKVNTNEYILDPKARAKALNGRLQTLMGKAENISKMCGVKVAVIVHKPKPSGIIAKYTCHEMANRMEGRLNELFDMPVTKSSMTHEVQTNKVKLSPLKKFPQNTKVEIIYLPKKSSKTPKDLITVSDDDQLDLSSDDEARNRKQSLRAAKSPAIKSRNSQ